MQYWGITLKTKDIRLNMIVMLLKSFRYRDMRDEVRVVLHRDEITRDGFNFRTFCSSRDAVCIH